MIAAYRPFVAPSSFAVSVDAVFVRVAREDRGMRPGGCDDLRAAVGCLDALRKPGFALEVWSLRIARLVESGRPNHIVRPDQPLRNTQA